MKAVKIKNIGVIIAGLTVIIMTSSEAFAEQDMIEQDGLVFLIMNENEAQVASASQQESYIIPGRITIDSKRYDVTSIGAKAFYNNPELISIQLPDNLRAIEDKAFAKCKNLNEINFPESLDKIGNYAFLECENLASALTFNSDVTLEDGCFSYCTSIESADLTQIHKLGIQTFQGCTALKTVKFNRNLVEIPDYSFSGCLSIEKIDLPASVIRIGEYAFSGNTKSESLTLPFNVKEIGAGSFSNCTAVTKITFKCKEASIGERAFEGLTNLTDLYTEGIRNIGSAAFADCPSLEWIEIGETTESMDHKAFSSCHGLKTIYSHPSWTPSIKFDTFDESTKKDAQLLVEESDLNTYRLAPNWCDFLHILPTEVFPVSVYEISEEQERIEILGMTSEYLRVKSNSPVQLYQSNGISISGKKVSEGIYDFKVIPGLIILRSSNGSKKMLLKE